MAEPIKHIQVGKVGQSAREDLDELIETLHETGVLRVLNGFFGNIGAVMNTLVQPIDTPAGRNLIGTLATIAESLGRIQPAQVQAAVQAAAETVQLLEFTSRRRPPSSFNLLLMLQRGETRRGIYTAIQLLQGLGRLSQRMEEAAKHGPYAKT